MILIFIVAIAASSFSQTAFPALTKIPGVNDSDVQKTIVIGDYDGDGSDDIVIEWQSQGSQPAYENYGIAIYSYSKNTYLLQMPWTGAKSVSFADLNNDKRVEVIIGNKIYAYTSNIVKKKT